MNSEHFRTYMKFPCGVVGPTMTPSTSGDCRGNILLLRVHRSQPSSTVPSTGSSRTRLRERRATGPHGSTCLSMINQIGVACEGEILGDGPLPTVLNSLPRLLRLHIKLRIGISAPFLLLRPKCPNVIYSTRMWGERIVFRTTPFNPRPILYTHPVTPWYHARVQCPQT